MASSATTNSINRIPNCGRFIAVPPRRVEFSLANAWLWNKTFYSRLAHRRQYPD